MNDLIIETLQARFRRQSLLINILCVLIPLFVIVGGIAAFSTYLRLQEGQTRLRQVNVELEETNTQLQQANVELEQTNESLQQTNAELRGIDTASSLLIEAFKDPHFTKKANSKYSLFIWSLGVDLEKQERMLEFFRTLGYTANARQASESMESVDLLPHPEDSTEESAGDDSADRKRLKKSPGWLSPDSAVLYYHPESLGKARRLARFCDRIANTRFRVARGRGTGVSPGRKRWYFNIHYIGSE